MKCRECGNENPDTRKFCRECGAGLLLLCSQCGFENLPGDKFCGECGSALRKAEQGPPIDYSRPQTYTPKSLAEKILTTRRSIEGERKLVTVLFSDVANYTSISERLDPEEVHRIMDGCFRILVDQIHRYEGTIDKFTGDGVMALFGAPVAHEDHAQRACHAALAIQKAIAEYGEKIHRDCGAEFKMRVGLNSGPVIVGTIGDDLRMEYTAIGDTTNMASRMETTAAAGTVRVSEHTHRLARNYFEFKSLGEVAVKGKEKPQPAYELLRPSQVETRFEASVARGLTRFVGRRKQMEALEGAFQQARTGAGQVVGIVGEAGVGKSRLILEFRNRLPTEGSTHLEGRCLHFGGSMPYLPILDIVKSYFDIEEEDREYLIKKKARERLVQLDEKLLVCLPSFHELLSLPVEDEKHLHLEPSERKQKTFEAIRDLLIRESEERPLLLAVEDLHWIDRTSRELLDYLIGWLANTRILLVLLYRPEFTHTWGSKSYYTQINLGQLSTRTSAELVQAILEEGRVVPELRDLILGRAGGNPLFVEELTHSLLENGSIHRKDDRYVLTREASEIDVPDTIQGIIAARLDRLEESLKRIMQVASVIGREFAYRILAAITGMKEDLKASLLNLQGLEFIYEKQLFPELEYIFKHVLTQEVAYNSLLLKRRRELHEKIGQAIEQIYAERLEEHYELLAYHYLHSENKSKAAEHLDLACQKAFAAGSMEDALGHAEQAMELLDTLPDTKATWERRMSVMVTQTRTLFYLLRLRDAYDLFARYDPRGTREDKPGERATLYYSIKGVLEFHLGFTEKAIQTVSKAVELWKAAGKGRETLTSYGILLVAYCAKGDFQRGLAFKDAIIRTGEETSDIVWYVMGLGQAAMYYAFLGRFEEGLEAAQMALRRAQEYSSKSQICTAAFCISTLYTVKRDLDRAVEYGEMAVAIAQTPGNRAVGQVALAWAWCHAGQAEKGTEILAAVLSVFRAAGYVTFQFWAGALLADGYRAAGRYEEAERTAREVLEVAGRCGAGFYASVAHFVLGESLSETDPKQAADHFEESIAAFREAKAEAWLPLAYAGYGRLNRRQGRFEQARDCLTKALSIFERLGILLEPDKVRKELAELPG
jgi:class 3 adenylate cyclase/tetratricopeptide (TPR) repeat protein